MRCGDKKRKKITRVVFQLRKIIVLYLHLGMEGTLVSHLLCLVGSDAILLASPLLLTIAVNFIIVFMFFVYILASLVGIYPCAMICRSLLHLHGGHIIVL